MSKLRRISPENGTPPSVELIDVELGYYNAGIFELAVGPLSFSAESGQAMAIVGPSGCGKSTLLMAMLGQIKPKSGSVVVKSNNLRDVKTAVVFQENSVFPWLTALDNVAYPLKLEGKPLSETRPLAFEWLTRVGLQKSASKYPHELSGGMVQRVALARALASKPNLLILDEPFGQVDELTRLDLGVLLAQLLKGSNITSVLVTHSIDEALLICNRVIALSKSPGQLVLDLDFDLPTHRTKQSLNQPNFLAARRKILDHLSPLDVSKFGQSWE